MVSTGVPSSVATSRITRAWTPFAIVLVLSVTVITTFSFVPFVSVSLKTHSLPGAIGQYGLSMSVVKSAGSSLLGSLPCGRPRFELAAFDSSSSPQAEIPNGATAQTTIAAMNLCLLTDESSLMAGVAAPASPAWKSACTRGG